MQLILQFFQIVFCVDIISKRFDKNAAINNYETFRHALFLNSSNAGKFESYSKKENESSAFFTGAMRSKFFLFCFTSLIEMEILSFFSSSLARRINALYAGLFFFYCNYCFHVVLI